MSIENKKKVLLISPSFIIAKGIESIFKDLGGEFCVSDLCCDLSKSNERKIKQCDADIILLDPGVFAYESRANIKRILSGLVDCPVVCIETIVLSENELKQFDNHISLMDEPAVIVRKIRIAIKNSYSSSSDKYDNNELSAREREILICVAKGMLSKEIADKYNISIYTVITHRKNITKKIGIKTVAGLTVYALLNNLIDTDSVE